MAIVDPSALDDAPAANDPMPHEPCRAFLFPADRESPEVRHVPLLHDRDAEMFLFHSLQYLPLSSDHAELVIHVEHCS